MPARYVRTRDEFNGHAIYTHEATGVMIRKVVTRGETQFKIYVPGTVTSVDGAFRLPDAKDRADRYVREIEENRPA